MSSSGPRHTFEAVERPAITQYVGPPFLPERTDEVAQDLLPRENLIAQELMRWHTIERHAANIGRTSLAETAQAQKRHLKNLREHDPRHTQTVVNRQKWIETGAVVLGIMRFLDAIGLDANARGVQGGDSALNPEEVDFHISFVGSNIRTSSVLFRNEVLEKVGAAIPQDRKAHYFESSELYVQAISPARPPQELQQKHTREFGRRLAVHEYTMFVPRLKRSFWAPPENPFASRT